MNQRVFLFDLDATVTKEEILPALSRQVGMSAEMEELTEKTMRGELPFKNSFLARVEMLRSIPVSTVSDIVANIPLHEELVGFIREQRIAILSPGIWTSGSAHWWNGSVCP